jgi:hypothetical protein
MDAADLWSRESVPAVSCAPPISPCVSGLRGPADPQQHAQLKRAGSSLMGAEVLLVVVPALRIRRAARPGFARSLIRRAFRSVAPSHVDRRRADQQTEAVERLCLVERVLQGPFVKLESGRARSYHLQSVFPSPLAPLAASAV